MPTASNVLCFHAGQFQGPTIAAKRFHYDARLEVKANVSSVLE
jgi:hypothetical protein